MRASLFLLGCLTASSVAAPTLMDDVYDYSTDLATFLGKVSTYIEDAEDLFTNANSCDTSKISLPSYASSLPSPSGLDPIYVAVGRGTQNYTCATSTSDSTPQAIGAVARLYNATCIAANYPDILELLPGIVYKEQLPSNEEDPLPPANLQLLGHHFFRDTTTPVFNLDTTPSRQYGIAISKKQSALDAPSTAIQGTNGAVQWLYLTTIDGTVGDYKAVYRVDTVAGAAPKTCQGMQSVFTVQYSANYYFYGA
ncbi:hypothetical protein BO94DRAFT_534496 [Aspergillus sclerotioniger CBS 115572]|uniref:Malate dehydrogenase n=1 Tax=Aspergillus sclerotioniger CBS 115572 TaxID=1450535 RepID=A0A317WTU6_9EURO|nr:hypothetical protein BO94DRAFT_534496 [Aspergillus sclerotioniger CBS 115572]PWY88607.1 hypothetical protein BO94DRAFT_534496 [Aspergillus sclerotioniger CBS 115572]